MGQFDVRRNPAGFYPPYLLVLSHDLIAGLPVVVVAPLVPLDALVERPIKRMFPVVDVDGTPSR